MSRGAPRRAPAPLRRSPLSFQDSRPAPRCWPYPPEPLPRSPLSFQESRPAPRRWPYPPAPLLDPCSRRPGSRRSGSLRPLSSSRRPLGDPVLFGESPRSQSDRRSLGAPSLAGRRGRGASSPDLVRPPDRPASYRDSPVRRGPPRWESPARGAPARRSWLVPREGLVSRLCPVPREGLVPRLWPLRPCDEVGPPRGVRGKPALREPALREPAPCERPSLVPSLWGAP